MARERDGGESFDPRTWGGGVSRKPAAMPPSSAAKVRPAPPPSMSPAAGTGAAQAATPLRLGLAGAALLLVSGALVAHFFPSRPSLPTASAMAAAAPVPTANDVPDHRTLTVADPTAIAASLRAAGIAGDVADGAAQEVGSVLGAAHGDIRLVIDLTGPASTRALTRLEATRDTAGVVLTQQSDGSYSSEPMEARLATGM